MHPSRVLARFLRAASSKKRMVVMMGPPAAGKGFFLGEPPPKYGWKLPKMLVDDQGNPLLTEADIPERPEQDESDNHLRAIQFEEAREQYEKLKHAHGLSQSDYREALNDHWYKTKDGAKVELGSVLKEAEDFPQDFKSYFDKTNKDFYVSMRGWHNDADEHNEETGKPKERFKDEARYRFEESVNRKIEKVDDLLIVDSAGEDIDAQDYKGQIDSAKAAGYEVTVIFLHPEQADTELSNLARGKVMGKRMVDQSDISNWYAKNRDALEDIQGANPDNFVHYRKGPPDPDPKKAEELRQKARDLMNNLSTLEGEEKEKAKKEINHTLYSANAYKLHKSTSYGRALSGLPKDPEHDSIAAAVAKMNSEAADRAKVHRKDPQEHKQEAPAKEDETKAPAAPKAKPKGTTRVDFLREMGDRKVSNPNPTSRVKYPQVKVRSLEWKDQKPYYEKWRGKAAAATVLSRFMRLKVAEETTKRWLGRWMDSLADEIQNKVKVEGYSLEASAGKGPEVFVTLKGASEDTTAARKAKASIEKIMDSSIEENSGGIEGFKHQVKSFNRNADVVLECTVIFPQ